jgi:voltage-gated potassium channel
MARSLQSRLFDVLFSSETRAGRKFEVFITILIVLSVAAAILESLPGVENDYGPFLRKFEWVVTIIFSVEYLFRVYCAQDRKRYVFSFFGIIDLIAVVPSFLSLFIGYCGSSGSLNSLILCRKDRWWWKP